MSSIKETPTKAEADAATNAIIKAMKENVASFEFMLSTAAEAKKY